MMTFEETLEAERNANDVVEEYTHQDGSVTIIAHDNDSFAYNPREDRDCNVATLVCEKSGFSAIDIDDDSLDLAEIREAATYLDDRLSDEWALHIDDGEETYSAVLEVGGRDLFDLEDETESWVALGYMMGWTGSRLMAEYVKVERPEVAYYLHEWSMSGHSPSDWSRGFAYVLHSDLERVGMDVQHAAKAVEVEVREYEAWARGDVFYAVNVFPTDAEYTIGDDGGYFTGEMLADTDTVHGFIEGEFNYAWIAEQVGGPIGEEIAA